MALAASVNALGLNFLAKLLRTVLTLLKMPVKASRGEEIASVSRFKESKDAMTVPASAKVRACPRSTLSKAVLMYPTTSSTTSFTFSKPFPSSSRAFFPISLSFSNSLLRSPKSSLIVDSFLSKSANKTRMFSKVKLSRDSALLTNWAIYSQA